MSSDIIPSVEHPNIPIESVDWRSEVNRCQKFLAAEMSSYRRSIPLEGRDACDEIAIKLPVIMETIRDLEKLHQSRQADLDRCYQQWQAAVSQRTGELGVLDTRVEANKTKLEQQESAFGQQESALNDQLHRTALIKQSLEQRQLEADRAFATTQANTMSAERRTSSLAEEKTRLESLKSSLEATERYQCSRTETLSTENATLHQEIADNNARERKLTRDQEAVRVQKEQFNSWKAWKDKQITDAKAESKKITEEKASLTEQLAASRQAYDDLSAGMRNYIVAVLPEKDASIRALEAFKSTSTQQIQSLDANKLELEGRIREKDSKLRQLQHDKTSLQDTAAKSRSEADLASLELEGAEERVASLETAWEEIGGLLIRNATLDTAVKECASQHSDIHKIRLQVSTLEKQNADMNRYKINFDSAKRLQGTSVERIKELEQEKGSLDDKVKQLQQRIDNLHDLLQSRRDDHNTAMEGKDAVIEVSRQRIDTLHDLLQSRQNDHNTAMDDKDAVIEEKDAVIEVSRLRIDAFQDELQSSQDDHNTAMDDKDAVIEKKDATIEQSRRNYETLDQEYDELFEEKETLQNEVTTLKRKMANLTADRDHLLHTANESRANADHLDSQPPSSPHSLKRNHDHLDTEEEDTSSVAPERLARRLEKAPRYAADVTTDASFSPLDDSTGAERGESSRQLRWVPTDSEADSARPLMNVAAPRALGTTNPTITPTNGAAFALSVNHAKLLNFSSDVLPFEILQTLQTRFTAWKRTGFNWSIVQQTEVGRRCMEARLERKKCLWDDGLEHACAVCEQRMRLCVVAHSNEKLLLLPRKKAEDEGKGPTDAKFWVR